MDFTKILTGNPDGVPSLGNSGPFSITGPYTVRYAACIDHHLLSHSRTGNKQQSALNNQQPSIVVQQQQSKRQYYRVVHASNQQQAGGGRSNGGSVATGQSNEARQQPPSSGAVVALVEDCFCGLQKGLCCPCCTSIFV